MSRLLSILLVIAILVFGWMFFFKRPDVHNSIKTGEPAKSTTHDFASWHDYKSPAGHFRALLPNLPQHVADSRQDDSTKEERDYEMYLATDDDGGAFSINTITYKTTPTDKLDDAFLEKTIREMLSHSGEESNSTFKMVPYKGGKAIDFIVENTKGYLVGRAFIKGNVLYVLTSINPHTRVKPESVEFFFNSFELTPAANTTKE